jgi:hypothetical protein
MKTKTALLFIALTLCLVFFSASANADCTTDRCYGQIERVYLSSSRLYIATDGDERNLACTATADVYITILDTDPNFNRYYAMMLTAMSTKTPVGLRIVTGSDGCTIAYTYMNN